eukprot:TRINITY_DN2901_c0_g1_i3.p1 TRINITY_DN2901_c0_g1~~TRINITY_DN2901_c0_g1_i3.p1  ORF type:complete len:451 (+),score=131.36 TRINITY_DN2901_c0_g1_i3:70-1422(+)
MFSALKKTFEFMYREGDVSKALMDDTIWKPDESLWVCFLSKEVTIRNLNKDHLIPYFVNKGYKVTQTNKGVRLGMKYDTKTIDTVVGYNEKEDRMIHAKFADENQKADKADNLQYFYALFADLADFLASNNVLRSLKYEQSKIIPYKEPLGPPKRTSKQEDALRTCIEKDCKIDNSNFFVAFLNKKLSREEMMDILLNFSGDSGLTCKMEGKSGLRSASSELVVQMKLGFNDKDVRILQAQNEATFLGGDKTGKIFAEFCKNLSWKLARVRGLLSQDSLSSPTISPSSPTITTPPPAVTVTPSTPISVRLSGEHKVLPRRDSEAKILARRDSEAKLSRRDSEAALARTKPKEDDVVIQETKIVVKMPVTNTASRERRSSIIVNQDALKREEEAMRKEEELRLKKEEEERLKREEEEKQKSAGHQLVVSQQSTELSEEDSDEEERLREALV